MAEASDAARNMPDGDPPVVWTRHGFFRGVRRLLPVVVSGVPFGLVFGVLARKAGLSVGEVALMSGLAFTGSGQVVAIEQWASSLPILPIVAAVALLGLRHILMGLTL